MEREFLLGAGDQRKLGLQRDFTECRDRVEQAAQGVSDQSERDEVERRATSSNGAAQIEKYNQVVPNEERATRHRHGGDPSGHRSTDQVPSTRPGANRNQRPKSQRGEVVTAKRAPTDLGHNIVGTRQRERGEPERPSPCANQPAATACTVPRTGAHRRTT